MEMSHAAHRFGTVEELRSDYNILVKPYKALDDVDEKTKEAAIDKTEAMAAIAFENGAVNLGRRSGCIGRGDDFQEIMKWRSLQGFFGAFSDKEKLKKVLTEYKKRDYGISVVAGGLIEEIFAMCREIGIKPHTILYSFGVWGKTELLPSEDHLKITTLCGHHMVSPAMIDHYVEKIKKGKISPEAAAKKLAGPCVCGIFNTDRTVEVLKRMAARSC
jgi:hypothetical protein